MNPVEYLLKGEADNPFGEEWKEFRRTQNCVWYISSLGRIKRLQVVKVKSKYNKKRGYEYVHYDENGVHKAKAVHRLVAESFIPNPENKATVNHKDGNKRNNCVVNLEWMTNLENQQHARKMGLFKFDMKKNDKRCVKFSDEQVARVVKLIKEDGWSYRKAGATEGMSYSTVAHIMTGRRRLVKGIPLYEKKQNIKNNKTTE